MSVFDPLFVPVKQWQVPVYEKYLHNPQKVLGIETILI